MFDWNLNTSLQLTFKSRLLESFDSLQKIFSCSVCIPVNIDSCAANRPITKSSNKDTRKKFVTLVSN